jgi:hypothetical protein
MKSKLPPVARNVTRPVPENWEKDALSAFIDMCQNNEIATFANKPEAYAKLGEIDSCFLKIGTNLANPSSLLPAFFLLRCHSAFRAAVRNAMSGQTAEVYPITRSCLELAGYAMVIFAERALGMVWLERHKDADSLKKVRNTFTFGRLKSDIQRKDAKLADLFDRFYQEAIDMGAHPNERALTSNMRKSTGEGETLWEQTFLHGDGVAMDHALKHVARVGLCCLFIFGHIFDGRFEILGLKPRIQALRAEL